MTVTSTMDARPTCSSQMGMDVVALLGDAPRPVRSRADERSAQHRKARGTVAPSRAAQPSGASGPKMATGAFTHKARLASVPEPEKNLEKKGEFVHD